MDCVKGILVEGAIFAAFTLSVLGFLPGCPRVTEEDLDISEVSFRYLFDHNASYAQEEADAYYLQIYGRDPPRRFLARF